VVSPSGRRARVGGCRRARAVASHLESEIDGADARVDGQGVAAARLPRLEQRHPRAVTVREVGRGQTRDPGADDRDRAPPVVPPLGARAGHLLSQHRREECAAGKARRRARAGESAAGFRAARASPPRGTGSTRSRGEGAGEGAREALPGRDASPGARGFSARGGATWRAKRIRNVLFASSERFSASRYARFVAKRAGTDQTVDPRVTSSAPPNAADIFFEAEKSRRPSAHFSRPRCVITTVTAAYLLARLLVVLLHADAPSPAASRTPARAPRRDAGFGRRARVRRVPRARARVVARRVVRRGGLLRDASG